MDYFVAPAVAFFWPGTIILLDDIGRPAVCVAATQELALTVQPMLSHLVIRNFAIIDRLEIAFRPGFTALTGETGAGKSIIIDALNLLLGGRASTEVIRTDEDEAVVEGVFEPTGTAAAHIGDLLDARGIDFDDQLIVRRIVSRAGRNKVFINGSLTTVSNLAEATRGLVDISGQHEHYSLVRTEEHIELLDAFAELGDEREKMDQAYREVRRIRRRLAELREDDRDRLHRIDFLRYQLGEIEEAELEPGEEEELDADVERLKYAEQISDAVRTASVQIHDGDGAAVEKLGTAVSALQAVAVHDERLGRLAERLKEANMLVTDAAHEVAEYGANIDSDPRRLDEMIARQETIKKLSRKHGSTIEEILAAANEMRDELHRLENAEELTEELEMALDAARRRAWSVALELSAKRREAARELEEKIEAELEVLNMSGSRFELAFQPAELPGDEPPAPGEEPTLHTQGFDVVEFMLAPNLGEEVRPLASIASGGELSRIMLAIKSVLVDRDTTSTYIFDEIDAGIGGSTADVVGAKIEATADSHQVLCITHLASIASRSDHHYEVEKRQVDGRTHSTIKPLDDDQRVEAIARMLGGERANEKTREAARELLGG